MEYATMFALMGTWIVYRELSHFRLKRNFDEVSELIGFLLEEKVGEVKGKGILEIKIHKIRKGE